MSGRSNRRQFLQTTALAGAGFWAAGGVSLGAGPKAASDKLNVAFVGVGGMGGGNLGSIAGTGENIVALCDVDDAGHGLGNKTASRFTRAKKYADFRKMLDEMDKTIDAVVVSTPDHVHAAAAMKALRMGKHVYCEKPLTWSVSEARLLRETAAEKKVATQMGNRGTATDGFRTGVEILLSGVLGKVKEAHVWTNRPIWPQGVDRPKGKFEVPKGLAWDLWLGPAPKRAYHPGLHPFNWRGWLDFGTGALGDMACHTANLAFMGLKLGYPTTVEAVSPKLNDETYPKWSTTTFSFPVAGQGPIKFVWYDGKRPADKESPGGKEVQNLPPEEIIRGLKLPGGGSGSIIVGEKGILYSPSDYGDQQTLLTPDRKPLRIESPERKLPRVGGEHYREWVNACKGGRPALSNFSYAGLLTEAILLGVVALRVGKKIEWDGEQMKATNAPEAARFVKREYRSGWTL